MNLFLNISYLHKDPSKALAKEPYYARKRSNAKLRQNLSKTEQTVKMNFFGVLLDLKSENVKLEKGKQNPDACCKRFAATDDVL